MSKNEMFFRSFLRPANYENLSPFEQYQIDKNLGILDWDGTSDFHINIGKKVKKIRYNRKGIIKSSKPFKSGLKINTVKDVVLHPIRKTFAYIFKEDDSIVDVNKCVIIENDTSNYSLNINDFS